MNESLMRLANAAGIEDGYWDGLGIRRDLREPTAIALLEALGFNATAHADAEVQYDSLINKSFLNHLAPSVVVRSGAPDTIAVAIAQHQRTETIRWELMLETGECLTGEFIPAQLTQLDEREIGGTRYGRFSLPLHANIGPGYHRFRLPALSAETVIIAAPARCFVPEPHERSARGWGLAVQLYTLRSSRNWGIGDFGDLAVLATAAGHAGAAFIGLNPLHARHLVRPDEASPYAPSSRLFLDPVYIDVEAVDEFADCSEARALIADPGFQTRLAAARNQRWVDYAAVTALKLPVLNCLFHRFRQRAAAADEARTSDFRAFKASGGEPLARFAEFEALRLYFQECTGNISAWFDWPEEYRQPSGSGMVKFRNEAIDRIEFQIYLQWIADRQLQYASRAARNAGMSIGLYRDLAVGAAHDSAEAWCEQQLFVPGIGVGAPPDVLNRQGQSWGLAPWNPRALVQQAYSPLRQLLAANMKNAGALRIDHVMSLVRLFWIPQGMSGADGGYVRQPFEALAAIVALESARNRCMVIGEDLGSVPDGLRARMHDRGFLSYRVLVYERHWHSDARFCLPDEYPVQSLATVATHDMPTMTEYWLGDDIARRAQLGMYPASQQRDEETARRQVERAGILHLLAETGLTPADPANPENVIASLHAAVARTRSMLAAVQLDDLVGESEPVNIPGTHREYPNWRRKLSIPIEEIIGDARWLQLAATMRDAGRC